MATELILFQNLIPTCYVPINTSKSKLTSSALFHKWKHIAHNDFNIKTLKKFVLVWSLRSSQYHQIQVELYNLGLPLKNFLKLCKLETLFSKEKKR